MTRKILVSVVALLLLATACSKTPTGPQKYAVDLDAKSTPKEKFQFSAFFPGSLTVSPGDSIKFRNRSTEAPHTITFGVNADRSNQPPIVLATGENDVVFKPCSSADAPTDKLVKCSNTKLAAFDGKGYWNSGVLQPKPAPKSAGDKSVVVKLAKDLKPGDYTFVCILHPLMNGKLTVVTDAGDRTKTSEARKDGRAAAKDARTAAEALKAPTLERSGNEVTVAAGWGDRVTSVNKYGPARIEVKTGTKVTWSPKSPYEPHTVTFESPFEVGDARGFGQGGAKSGADYSGGFANSGIIGAKGSPFEGNYSLTFTKAGTYSYVCLLHPGQTGSVVVK